jgi:hypothetical protein
MSRVAKADHATILRMVDVEHRKVPDVAAQYGCTPANIYAILKRMRAGEGVSVDAEPANPEDASVAEAAPAASTAAIVDLFSAPPPVEPRPIVQAAPEPVMAARSVAKGGSQGVGKMLKPGFGFHMRTAEGEESVMPFRSLEDLLSAAKGILRGAAKSPEPVWFSIQSLDLSTVDADAA